MFGKKEKELQRDLAEMSVNLGKQTEQNAQLLRTVGELQVRNTMIQQDITTQKERAEKAEQESNAQEQRALKAEQRAVELETLLSPIVASGKTMKIKLSEYEQEITKLRSMISQLQSENATLKASLEQQQALRPQISVEQHAGPIVINEVSTTNPPNPPTTDPIEQQSQSNPMLLVPKITPQRPTSPGIASNSSNSLSLSSNSTPQRVKSPSLPLSARSISSSDMQTSSNQSLQVPLSARQPSSPRLFSSTSQQQQQIFDPNDDIKQENCTKTPAQIKYLLRQLIKDSEKVPEEEIEKHMTNFVSKFNGHLDQLEMIVVNYPFLVHEHPTSPTDCFKKMKAWETLLFSKIEKKEEVSRMRKNKSVEIRKTPIESIPELCEKILQAKNKIVQEKKKAAEVVNTSMRMNNVLDDIKRRGEEAEKRRLEQLRQSQAAQEQSSKQEEEIDFS